MDHVAIAPIIIIRLTSISGQNEVKPVQQVKRKQVGCLCCAAGDVEFVAKLPRTGYCVINGDVIPLKVDVQNNSTRVIRMRAKIIKRVWRFVRSNSNVSSQSVAKISSEPIQPGASYTWNPTDLIVPATPPTLLGSRILRVDYVLEVSAVIPKALNASCNIPLFLGNLPYMTSANIERAILDAIVKALLLSRASTARAAASRDNVDKQQ